MKQDVLNKEIRDKIQKTCFLSMSVGGQKAIMDAVLMGQTPIQIEAFVLVKLNSIDNMPQQKKVELANQYFLAARYAATLCRTADTHSDNPLEVAPHAV